MLRAACLAKQTGSIGSQGWFLCDHPRAIPRPQAAVSAFRNFDKAIQKDAGSVCGTVVVEVERWLCFMLESFEALLR